MSCFRQIHPIPEKHRTLGQMMINAISALEGEEYLRYVLCTGIQLLQKCMQTMSVIQYAAWELIVHNRVALCAAITGSAQDRDEHKTDACTHKTLDDSGDCDTLSTHTIGIEDGEHLKEHCTLSGCYETGAQDIV